MQVRTAATPLSPIGPAGKDSSPHILSAIEPGRCPGGTVRYYRVSVIRPASIVALLVLPFALNAQMDAIDDDRDGIPDALEDQLIERFKPRFKLSASDCDVMPAEFQPGVMEPIAIARNGTIYAQVFPVTIPQRDDSWVEIHYYHLWANDCGRIGHKYDVEHVSALVHVGELSDPVDKWKAKYWYAAAHEDTVCDSGNGAKASSLDAEEKGSTVWISSGKHASFLAERLCRWGCGGDRCENITWLSVPKIVNVGERGAPLNGSLWIDSPLWPMQPKLSSDFTPAMLAQLDNPKSTTARSANNALPPLKAVILGGGKTVESLALSNRKTGEALSLAGNETDNALVTATDKTEKAVGAAATSTGRSIRKSVKAVGDFLGAGKSK